MARLAGHERAFGDAGTNAYGDHSRFGHGYGDGPDAGVGAGTGHADIGYESGSGRGVGHIHALLPAPLGTPTPYIQPVWWCRP